MNTKDIQTNRKRKIIETNVTNDKKSRSDVTPIGGDLWVEKYRPMSTKQVIGQQGDKSCVNKLLKWLSSWHKNLDKKPNYGKLGSDDGQGYRAALLSGPPGIGKTTSAQLVCKELGFEFIELNASDARNKKCLEGVVKELLKNTTLTEYFNSRSSHSGVSAKHVVIMDEVDGMAGNEDRGGIAELIQLIKSTKVPILCICNDRAHPKMRSLVNYCFDLRFYRPRVEQIKASMMSIAYKEGVTIAPDVLHQLIVSSNQDIRQVIGNLALLCTGTKRVNNLLSDQSIKDVRLSTFDSVRKVFSGGEEYARMSFQDKSDLFFCDYSIMGLFNFENYIHVKPTRAKSEAQRLSYASKAIEAMAFGDLIEKQIRTTNNWSLLPLQAAFASVMPGAYMNGHLGHMITFPAVMGKMSTTNKRIRLLQELKMHMNLKISGSLTALILDYLEPLRDSIIEPLVHNSTGGIPQSLEKLENYCLRREDIESITELTLWSNQTDPMSRVDSKTKAALTRVYNKKGLCLPYSLGTVTKGRKGKSVLDMDEGEGEDNPDSEGLEEDNGNDILADAMVQKKKNKKKTGTEKESKPKSTGRQSKGTEKESKDSKPKPTGRQSKGTEKESKESKPKSTGRQSKATEKESKESKPKTTDRQTNGKEKDSKPKSTGRQSKGSEKESNDLKPKTTGRQTMLSFFKKL